MHARSTRVRTAAVTSARPLIAALIGAALAAPLSLAVGATAHAVPLQTQHQAVAAPPALPMPDGTMTLVIHPAGEDQAARSHTQSQRRFELRRVPGIDVRTLSGWNTAAQLSVPDAAKRVIGEPAVDTGVTGGAGDVVFADLAVGLYYVVETASDPGVLPTTPFLVMLPLPNPDKPNEWLTTVNVYPKTAAVSVELEVADSAAVVCGDPVRWTSVSAIPAVSELSRYRVEQVLAPGVRLSDALDDVSVAIADGPELRVHEDYEVRPLSEAAESGFAVDFLAPGIEHLLADTDTEVEISYLSQVTQPGVFNNEVRLFAGDALPVSDETTTKFGPLRILVHERGVPTNLIGGADFKLYANASDAASGEAPVRNGQGSADLRTVADGTVTVGCLRYSNHADGLELARTDDRFRSYFARPISYPAGWDGDEVLLRGEVRDSHDPETLLALVWRAGKGGTPQPGGPLTETGGQVLGALGLGAVLVVAGGLTIARRRGRTAE